MSDTTGGSTKQLNKVLGFWDLMGTAVGQIIGAGVMVLLGMAISMTGRSVPFAFSISALLMICSYLPFMVISGTVRLRGGQYTMLAMLMGKSMAGAYVPIHIFGNVAIGMYALSFASYFISLFTVGNEKMVAFVVLTIVFLVNLFGVDKFAKFQNLIVLGLVVALGLFVAFGIGKVDPDYMAAETLFTGGTFGFLRASGLLTQAVIGGFVVTNLSAEAKNPTRDIPLVMIVSTIGVAVIYAVIAVVAAGVLPIEEVAGQNLSVVAEVIFSRPLYIFFIVCGAGFALLSTLNGTMAWAPKPVMQACDDGWLPMGLARLTKWKTPVIIQSILYVVAVITIFSGLDVSILSNMSMIATSLVFFMIDIAVVRLPKACPEIWEKSKFKVSTGVLYLFAVLGGIGSMISLILNWISLDAKLMILNVVVIAGAMIFGAVRGKNAHMDISYEAADENE